MVNVEPTLVENDSSIVCGSGSTERSLSPNADSVHDLEGENARFNSKRDRGLLLTFECPMISPVDEPVSIMNACPNLPGHGMLEWVPWDASIGRTVLTCHVHLQQQLYACSLHPTLDPF